MPKMQRIADDRVATYHDSVGLIIGVIEPTGRRLIARGPAQIGNDDPVNGDTIFQIGSVTKLFTAALLADMGPSRGSGANRSGQEISARRNQGAAKGRP